MIYNDENIGIGKVIAYYDEYIYIASKDGKKELYLSFNRKNYNFQNMQIGKTINLIEYIYWDTTLQTEETYYLFDITKDKVILTKVDNNKYKLELEVNCPDMIYCPLGKNIRFNNLKVDVEFSFNTQKINKDSKSPRR